MLNRKLTAAAVGMFLLGVLAACGAQQGNDSAVTGPVTGDKIPAEIYSMPDGFSNYSLKCVHGIWWMTIYHQSHDSWGYGSGSGVPAVPGDPACPSPAKVVG